MAVQTSSPTAGRVSMFRRQRRPRRLRGRFGLRRQIVAAFTLGALLLSVLLSLIAYSLTRSSLLERIDQAASARLTENAEFLAAGIGADTSDEEIRSLIVRVNRPAGVEPVLVVGGRSFSPRAFGFTVDDIDPNLRDAVSESDSFKMRYRRSEVGTTNPTFDSGSASDPKLLVIGVNLPIEDRNALYFEATSLEDVESTLGSIGPILLAATGLTALTAIALGFSVANRLLRPLQGISQAAERIAGGDLSTRLDEESDRDLKRLTHSFNDMATSLERRIERDARFASDVSHELRSPLMTLTASAAIVENHRDELPEKVGVASSILTSDLDRFKHLVEDLLEISKFDVGAAALETSPLPVGEFIRQAVAFAGKPELPVKISHAAEGIFAQIDKRRMGQVIRNLLDNADNYGDGADHVTVERQQTFGAEAMTSDLAVIAVEDSGPGVPVSERERIFERFFRGAEGGRRGSGTGSGLGLSLVREHVRLHGGDIRVVDRPDGKRGSRFEFEIPVVDIDSIDLW